MTTSRYSGLLAGVALSGCAQNLPSSDTELGRIVRMRNIHAAQGALKAYSEALRGDAPRLKAELIAANFTERAKDPAPRGRYAKCDYFDWNGRHWGDVFEGGLILGICPDGIHVGGGYDGL